MDLETRIELISKLGGAFSPSAPVHQKALFAGRMAQLMAVVTAVEQRGQHVVLFGERGVGKTSLATIITRIYEGRANVAGCRSINCDPTMSFAKLWNSILREMTYEVETPAAGFTGEATKSQKSLASEVPPKPTPDDVRHLLSKLGQTIIVIDELDRLTDTTATGMIADTIKTLSDHDVQTTLILVGVADSIDALIAQHQSVERALVQIRMPRMSQEELHQILDVGYGMVGLTADNDAKARIATLSQGLPHYTHTLALHAGQSALTADRMNVSLNDVATAIDAALDQAQQSIISAHHKATSSSRENLYPQVLLACALAETDDLGYFAAADVREPMTAIMGRPYDIPAFSQHLNKFCEAERGAILQRTGATRRYRFRFSNPLMQPFIVMNGLRKKLISEATLAGV